MEMKHPEKNRGVRVFSLSDNQCIWMKAGVVNYRLCDNAFDCTTCAFDTAMSRKVDQKPVALVSWREVNRGKPFFQRECRHMLTGRVQFKFCAHSYECHNCEYDQLLDEEELSGESSAVYLNRISGFVMADGYYYHAGHSWARIEHGGFVRLGIDDFASRLLGDLSDISLPQIGSELRQGENCWSVHRSGKSAAMLAPINGRVMAINPNALKQLDSIKNDPYGEGWLVVVDPRGGLKKNVRNLLFEKTAVSWLKEEVKKLEEIRGVPLAAAGGDLVSETPGDPRHIEWEDLVRDFLHT